MNLLNLIGLNKIEMIDKAYTCKQECVNIGYNKAIREIESKELVLNEEAIMTALHPFWTEATDILKESYRNEARRLAAALPQLLILREVKEGE